MCDQLSNILKILPVHLVEVVMCGVQNCRGTGYGYDQNQGCTAEIFVPLQYVYTSTGTCVGCCV